ncbi:MAG TPA: ABC transporter ATP-binding protein [Actinomycetes bacterium]|nr:ABC transporter ATP-binding protein [Actinomycetes bacterium]
MSDPSKIAVSLRGLTKRYGRVTAVDGIDLDIREGELLTLLGPSGSGKTTTLRMVAGFELPSEGTIHLGGVDVTGRPPFERDVNTVFQDYALFPHMSVAGNVDYGLRVRKVAKAERRERVAAALARVRLDDFGERRPSQLSGGQRQRVALARALVNRPRVLLLDEPLGALDRQLRQEMQVELKAIQAAVGITFVVVTHDQEEALTMSDRIAVLRDGRIEQVGAPAAVYERPANPFVAGFVGTSNVLAGRAAAELVGEPGTFTVRPEKIQVLGPDAEAPAGHCQAAGTVRDVAYAGPVTRLTVTLEVGGELVVLQQNLSTTSAEVAALAGSRVKLVWRPEHNFRLSPAPVPASAGG